MMLTKLDLKKDLSHLYKPSAKAFSTIAVPPMNFLMIDGMGNPNTSVDYKNAVEALYAAAYALKFNVKKTQAVDYSVMPLEGLWWMDNMAEFSMDRRDEWKWTMMIMQPELATRELVLETIAQVQAKKKLPALGKIRFERFNEGMAAQILYFGSYKDEGPTIARLHQFISEQGGKLTGKHHEIYVGDPRKSAPEKLKTIIRQPFQTT